uniref:Uncharacterized protein n=1 Tax=Rhizophora mucronata TaxID=61149 RepID=A0A2P2PRD5_RHIMU
MSSDHWNVYAATTLSDDLLRGSALTANF